MEIRRANGILPIQRMERVLPIAACMDQGMDTVEFFTQKKVVVE
jgi:hypothetical protein